MRPGDAASIWTFTVSRVFKGTLGLTVRVASPRDGGSCGLELPLTGPALVFTQAPGVLGPPVPGVDLSASLCNGTRSLIGAHLPPSFGGGGPPGRLPPAQASGTRSTKGTHRPGRPSVGMAAAAGLVLGRDEIVASALPSRGTMTFDLAAVMQRTRRPLRLR